MSDVTRTGNPFFDAWMDAGRRFLEPIGQSNPMTPMIGGAGMSDAVARAQETWELCQRQTADWVKASSRFLASGSRLRRRRRDRRGDAAEDDGPDAVPLRRHRRDQPGDPAAGRGAGVRRHRHHRAPGAEGDARVDGAARGERRLSRRDVGGLDPGVPDLLHGDGEGPAACCNRVSAPCSTAGSSSPTTS